MYLQHYDEEENATLCDPRSEDALASREGAFTCPVYKTRQRAGTLSTTGQSTNIITYVSLPVAEGTDPSHWVVRGAAAVCTLDD